VNLGMEQKLTSACFIVKIWTDDKCNSQNNVITVKKAWGGIGQCEQPGPQIGSMSVVCQ
jgi:hypothetical protein